MPTRKNDRLKALAKWLEKGAPEHNGVSGFDMSDYAAHITYTVDNKVKCGSVCCIAGAACYFWGRVPEDHSDYAFHENGRRLLGLSKALAEELFLGSMSAEPEGAAKVVRHLVKTGAVDWGLADE